MLWIFGGDFYQTQTLASLAGPITLPLVAAVRLQDEAASKQS